jgi:hypothetical protein
MKRLLCLAAALCLLLSLCSFAGAEEPDWVGAYSAILDAKQAEAAAQEREAGYDLYWEYTIYDIDKDGAPELIVKMGTCEADYHGALYTFAGGQALLVTEEIGLGHSSFYTDPDENGIILMQGHMGYAWAQRLRLENSSLSGELLYEDDLNARLETDPEAEYLYPGDVIPGAVYLTPFRLDLRLPLHQYEQILGCLTGRFPVSPGALTYPNGDPDFFYELIGGNGTVTALSADGFANSPGRIGFRDLMKQDVAANWMSGDLEIRSTQLADLNGDGKAECIVELSKGDPGDLMRFFLCEEGGTVYAYLNNYAMGELTVDRNGNLMCSSEYFDDFYRLLFSGGEAMLLSLPKAFYAP